MYLGNPMLPLKVSAKENLEIIKKELQKNNWTVFELGKPKLILVPYFYFKYHFFEESEKNGEKIIQNSSDGELALNASNLSLEQSACDIIKKSFEESTNKLERNDFETIKPIVEKKEIKKILPIKTGEFFKIPKKNIIITEIKNYYLPRYKTKIFLNKKEYDVLVSAVDGKIICFGKIPFREKGVEEVVKETLFDLSDPKNWLKYLKEILEGTKDKTIEKVKEETKIKRKGPRLNFFSSEIILVLIIIIALFLIFVAIFV